MDDPRDMTLADHAEEWARKNGETIPPRDSEEWKAMYQRWCDYAFANFGNG